MIVVMTFSLYFPTVSVRPDRHSGFGANRFASAFGAADWMHPKSRDAPDDRLDVIRGNQPGAFELARRVLVAWAPQEVLVVEAMRRVVSAAIADVIVDRPVGRRELVRRMGEARDHRHRMANFRN
jgi:hypothetical protein